MKIKFLASDEDYAEAFDPPIPSSQLVPEWYRQQEPYVNNDKSISEKGMYSSTVKHCMPAIDAITAGYVFCFPCDIHVTSNTLDGGITTSWPVDRKMVESHSAGQVSKYPIDTSVWNPAVLKLINEWTIQTPPGYSTLFTAPFWRGEYRFMPFTGVVDTDKYPQAVNFPFLIRNGFTGLIENGTPFVQLIPFKRDDWESEVGVNTNENRRRWLRATRDTIHRYKRNFRVIKNWS